MPAVRAFILVIAALLFSKPAPAGNVKIATMLPMIHGEINGMKVMAQGDAVTSFAAGKPSPLLNEEECARDLNCAMQKNKTEAVVLNPSGRLFSGV